MPRMQHYYEPDALDCNAMQTAIAEDFSCVCEISTDYGRDEVRTVVKCRKIGGSEASVVQVQAMVKAPLKGAKSLYILQYSALFDCWCQLDRGVTAVAARPIQRGWNGRPQRPTPQSR